MLHLSSASFSPSNGWAATAFRSRLSRVIDIRSMKTRRSHLWSNSFVNFSRHERSECKRESAQQSISGFTLIEVLVALTLLGLIATMVVAGTRLGLDMSARGTANTDTLRTEQLQRSLLRSQLRGALPFRYWTHQND